MTDETPLRSGIVGCGNIGQYHADRLQELGADLVGGMDVSTQARDRFAQRYGVDAYDDHHALYDAIDVVVITTPNRFHEEYAVDAFEHDLHVLLEKPLAHSLESAERIAAAARESRGTCTVGFHNRFRNAVRLVADRIERGDLGEITHVEANYVRRRGVPGRGSWFTRRDIAGGGALIDLGVHAIDLALYLHQQPEVSNVSGVTRSEFGSREDYAYLEMWGEDAGPEGFDVDDSASAFVRCADDRTISLEVAWATNRPPTHEFVVQGTEAAARFDLLEDQVTLHTASPDGANHFVDSTLEPAANDAHSDEQRAFLGVIRGGEDAVGASAEEALAVQRVVDSIYRSSDEGHPITLEQS
ncbi:Gfo/Idh/MocA family protein [Natronosalvus caseinilyticus]|uniref:Gfo/Idh/MocA family protein n=1 Tax=Natronosalvus caseinilyticus TaxID=2953747 RepID=UPI0028B23142|nr:Gfo/Idh/MocA family oxidoreductase [Natronosalvus caseinilyticus]